MYALQERKGCCRFERREKARRIVYKFKIAVPRMLFIQMALSWKAIPSHGSNVCIDKIMAGQGNCRQSTQAT